MDSFPETCHWASKVKRPLAQKGKPTCPIWPTVLFPSPSHDDAYTAISRKVVGKSARNNTKRNCGWFWVHWFSKKFEIMAGEATDVCLLVLKESNKSSFDSYSVRNSVMTIFHITFQNCRMHIFSDNLCQNTCIHVCSVQFINTVLLMLKVRATI